MEKLKMNLQRNDIKLPNAKAIKVYINSEEKIAYEGETILNTLMSYGIKEISKNDHNQKVGAYCGMGICFCCTVSANHTMRRACKTIVSDEMRIDLLENNNDLVENYTSHTIKPFINGK